MKLLFINTYLHHKNIHALNNYNNIDIIAINSIQEIDNINLNDFDCVYSPSEPINTSLYPNTKFIFGPHFSVFPDDRLNIIKSNNSNVYYNLLSTWVGNYWKQFDICHDLNICYIPFGVDTELFTQTKDINDRDRIFIYYKHRNPLELNIIEYFLKEKNIEYTIFIYGNYNEEDYIKYLQNSKYGIWIDAHESQGFALQEALSCNVPLLVWNVSSMNQEYGQNYNDIPATSVPYWDNICGEVFYNIEDIDEVFNKFILNLKSYNPRKFVLENLSIAICEKKLVDFINSF